MRRVESVTMRYFRYLRDDICDVFYEIHEPVDRAKGVTKRDQLRNRHERLHLADLLE